jgi:hypothetical protein
MLLSGIAPLSVWFTTAPPALDPTLQPQTTHRITIATITRVHRIVPRMTPFPRRMDGLEPPEGSSAIKTTP